MSDQRNNQISKTQVMALAKALEAVETYVPTTWVDDTEPDIDAEHLNHAEQGIKRVTDALNGAVATINNLAAQLANYIPVSKIVDNLLSTDPTTVLSGKMGKQLSDLITANSNAISTLNSDNGLLNANFISIITKDELNKTKSNGWRFGYILDDTSTEIGLPNIYHYVIMASSGQHQLQLIFSIGLETKNTRVYLRSCHNQVWDRPRELSI